MNNEFSEEGKVLDKITETVDKISKGIKKAAITEKKISLWISKGKNLPFYRKYLGRMESGAWERYGSEAEVLENRMVGDPVIILRDEAKEAIKYLSSKIQTAFNTLSDISSQAESGCSLKELKKSVDKYVEERVNLNFVMEESKDNSYKFKIKRATATRIADALLWGGRRKIYGYTTESLVVKKLPPPNHTVVTLFVENPEESPTTQSVTDIFDGPESIRILASSEKTKDFNIFEEIKMGAMKSVDKDKLLVMRKTTSKMKSKFKKTDDPEDKERYEIVKALNKSINHLVKMQNYAIDCAVVYFDMILRVDKLARKSMEAILQVEQSHRDKNYDPGVKYAKPKNESDSKNKERYRDLKKTAWYLNKGKHVKDDY